MSDTQLVEQTYKLAKEQYTALGVNTDEVIERVGKIPISINCWQGDDVGGFESEEGLSDGGIQATGNYPGKARTANELRTDLEKVLSLLPGEHRVNLHAMYAETKGKIDRDELKPELYNDWIDWAKNQQIGLDFNPTFFSHPKAADGFTLAHYDEGIRKFWIDHGIACRKIGEHIGRQLGTPCITNIWVPDGYKDSPVNKRKSRDLLKDSLDKILAERIDPKCNLDSVESKLFGIGAESFTVGSHEFYLGYAVANDIMLCLDSGHYHPTEVISDKISAVMNFVDELLLHVSRPVRWDSDHVVILSDEIRAIAQEVVRGDYLDRVHIALDFFDASINRIAAWTIGTRNTRKALLLAMLEPIDKLQEMEAKGDYTGRLAMLEELKTMPFGAVWDYYCLKAGMPVGLAWLDEVREYEKKELSKRS